MLLNFYKNRTAHSPQKELLVPNVNSAEVEKLCFKV